MKEQEQTTSETATAIGAPLLNQEFARQTAVLLEAGVFSDTELYLVDTVAHRFGEVEIDVLLALALAARAPRVGHVGVDLRTIAGRLDRERFNYCAAIRLTARPSKTASSTGSSISGRPNRADRPPPSCLF